MSAADAHRPLDRRAFALDEVERNAHRLERQQQIGEQDGGVDLDPPDGLQRDFGRQIRRAAQLQKCVVLAEGAVFRHVASGLPHEPDGRAVDGFAPARAQRIGSRARRAQCIMRAILSSLFHSPELLAAIPGGPVSPILVRPVREQFEHDRVIRLLQARYKRKYEVAINPGAEQNASVSVGELPLYPDLVLFESRNGRKLQGTVEVETGESVNTLEAMAEWGPFSRLRAPFFLYVPANSIDTARRLCSEHQCRRRPKSGRITPALDQVRFTMVHRAPEARASLRSGCPRSR